MQSSFVEHPTLKAGGYPQPPIAGGGMGWLFLSCITMAILKNQKNFENYSFLAELFKKFFEEDDNSPYA